MTTQQRLLTEKSIQTLIAKCKEALAIYEAKTLIYEEQLHPEQTAERLRRELTAAKSIEETVELQSKLAKFRGDDAHAVAITLQRHIGKDFDGARVLLLELISEAMRLLNTYRQAALQSERQFFAGQNLPHEPTAVSRQFNAAMRELEHEKESIAPAKQHPGMTYRLPDARATVLNWFGVQDIA
ncbi:MAG TPA: hypothetical protein VN873_02460 [Candidatus Angelobacter sp.]|nr:hypothetical protein [Candidatus Angelobacter sp.]